MFSPYYRIQFYLSLASNVSNQVNLIILFEKTYVFLSQGSFPEIHESKLRLVGLNKALGFVKCADMNGLLYMTVYFLSY